LNLITYIFYEIVESKHTTELAISFVLHQKNVLFGFFWGLSLTRQSGPGRGRDRIRLRFRL